MAMMMAITASLSILSLGRFIAIPILSRVLGQRR